MGEWFSYASRQVPQLIVEEAGGRFTDLGGVRSAEGGDAIATNSLVHDAALAIIGR